MKSETLFQIVEILDDLRQAIYWLDAAMQPHASQQIIAEDLARAEAGTKKLIDQMVEESKKANVRT